MKYFKTKKYYVVVILILVCVFLLIFSLLIKKDRNPNKIESFIKDSIVIINKNINIPARLIKIKYREITTRKKIYQKYQKLKKENNQNKIAKIENQELKEKIKKLEKTLDLNDSLKNKEYINAMIVFRNIGYFYDEVTIDKGSSNNVKKNMAVINSEGLIGIVSKVSKKTSVVKLITTNDTNNKISVKIKIDHDKYLYGLLSGYDKKTNCFFVSGIANNEEIPIGSLVTTAGLGNNLPSGILIGEVSKITKDNFDLARTLKIKSNVNFNNIDYVTLESGA